MNWFLFHAAVLTVPVGGEVISSIDQALTAPNGNHFTSFEVLRHVVSDITEVEAWVMSKNWDFSQFLSSEEHREWIATIVRLDDLFDLNSIVTEEEVKTIVLITAIV